MAPNNTPSPNKPSGKPAPRSASGSSKSSTGKGPAGKGSVGSGPAGKGSSGSGPAGRSSGGVKARKGGKGGRKAVVVKTPRPWGLISLGVAVALAAVGIIGYGAYQARDAGLPFGQQAAQKIDGVVNYRVKDPKSLTRNHKTGDLKYKVSPPVGGDHNPSWQNCEGDVYGAQIADENGVHSLEHGSVWITYRPDLPKDQVAALAKKVKGRGYMLMSPYPGLDKPISLQAWGFQLKLDKASDPRVDKFIKAFRTKASVEAGAVCSNGVTETGTEPKTAPAAGGSMP